MEDNNIDNSVVFSLEDLGSVFTDALLEVISTVSGFSFDVLPSDNAENSIDFDGMIGVMSLKGEKKNGIIFISAGDNDMRILCSFMTGIPQEEITETDMYDGLCELVNMTAGNAKLRIRDVEYMFTLSWPFAITGENMSIITKKRVHVISKTLGNGEISVKLKVIY